MIFFHTIVENFTKVDGFHVYEGIGGELTLVRVLTFGGTGDSQFPQYLKKIRKYIHLGATPNLQGDLQFAQAWTHGLYLTKKEGIHVGECVGNEL